MTNEKRLIDANAIHYCFYDLDNYHSFSAVTDDEIAEMPTVDAVEVVHGRWVCLEPIMCLFICSECGQRIVSESFNYCPNCGAKMDGDWNA